MRLCRALVASGAMLIAGLIGTPANAAVWAWGCAGSFDKGEQILFNRYVLLVLDKATDFGLRKVIDANGLDDHPHRLRFDADDVNAGFEPTMTFKPAAAGAPLVLTERSSKRIGYREGRVGPRDEYTTRWRKVYRLSGGDLPPHEVTMECMEYMLSTKGGRQ